MQLYAVIFVSGRWSALRIVTLSFSRSVSYGAPAKFYAFADQIPRVVNAAAQNHAFFIAPLFVSIVVCSATGLSLHYHYLSDREQIIEAFVSGNWLRAWMINRAAGWPA